MQKLKLAGLVTLSTAILLFFNNCGENGVELSSIREEFSSIKVTCKDEAGQIRQNGEVWDVQYQDDYILSCSADDETQQVNSNTDSYLCADGTAIRTGNSQVAVNGHACPTAKLESRFDRPWLQENDSTQLIVHAEQLQDIRYDCRNSATGAPLNSGVLLAGDSITPFLNVREDTSCSIKGKYSNQVNIEKVVSFALDCESSGKLKNPSTGKCEVFACKSFELLTYNSELLEVPKRTFEGKCYALKLIDAEDNYMRDEFGNVVYQTNAQGDLLIDASGNLIPKLNDSADGVKGLDPEFFANKHNSLLEKRANQTVAEVVSYLDGLKTNHPEHMFQIDSSGNYILDSKGNRKIRGNVMAYNQPYLVARREVNFLMKSGGGARQVLLSNGPNAQSGVNADNFIAVGLMKQSDVNAVSAAHYAAFGHLAASLGQFGEAVLFRNQLIPFSGQEFGNNSYTSEVLDITSRVSTDEPYYLDIRALDCGGSRSVTDAYLLFR